MILIGPFQLGEFYGSTYFQYTTTSLLLLPLPNSAPAAEKEKKKEHQKLKMLQTIAPTAFEAQTQLRIAQHWIQVQLLLHSPLLRTKHRGVPGC